jgi:pyruvate formate lyase activating enzyme
VISIKLNFGGFVPLSTVDWRGRSVCTVFLRGCPLRCSYCQNEAIQSGEDYRDVEDIIDMIKTSAPFISGVMFSGGEPAAQKDALLALAKSAREMNLAVGIQTSGHFFETLRTLINKKMADKVAIDYKTRWEEPGVWEPDIALLRQKYQRNVSKSIEICKNAVKEGILTEFEVVVTLFHENKKYIKEISDETTDIPLVLQQGEHKIPMMPDNVENMTAYIAKNQRRKQQYTPMTLAEIKKIAENLKRDVRIRTRDVGEITCNRRFIL